MERTHSRKRFFVAPMDWGLGHAARCIPLIRALRKRGHEVIIGAKDAIASLISEEFPDIGLIPLSGYSFRYTSNALFLMLKFPLMVAHVYRQAAQEHKELENIVNRYNIDYVISDQRFGLHTKKIPSIYISHQLCVKMPSAFGFLEQTVSSRLRAAAEEFDELWIPDFSGTDNITGDLTGKYPLPSNHKFIGILSRFATGEISKSASHNRDLLLMLSGPEPQRTMLELKLLRQLGGFKGTATVLRATPGRGTKAMMGKNIEIQPHLSGPETLKYLAGANAVVCRGGYTTIMELVSLRKKAVLVPTPGQTEQEYLCARLAGKGEFVVQKQKSLDIQKGIRSLENIPPLPEYNNSSALLDRAIDSICTRF